MGENRMGMFREFQAMYRGIRLLRRASRSGATAMGEIRSVREGEGVMMSELQDGLQETPRKPKRLTSRFDRRMARNIRDSQWAFMELAAELGTVWVCWWNKNGHHPDEGLPRDLMVHGLIDGMEFLEWLNSHKDWWVIGEWSDERYAAPVSITEAGRAAFADHERYDMELVTGGLVEPGWCAMPLPPRKVAAA
jgi:hypothetical protein